MTGEELASPYLTETVRALHEGYVTFHGRPSGYRVPPELEAVFREAIATGRSVTFRASDGCRILAAELSPPRSRVSRRRPRQV